MDKRLFTELAQRLVAVSPDRTIRVAIDGVDGAGKTTFADELGSSVSALGRPVIRASVDGFHNPRLSDTSAEGIRPRATSRTLTTTPHLESIC